MVGLVWERIADDLLTGCPELVDREFDKTKSFVSDQHFAWISTLASDYDGHRLVIRIVIERRAVGAFLARLLGKMTRRDPSPDNGLRR